MILHSESGSGHEESLVSNIDRQHPQLSARAVHSAEERWFGRLCAIPVGSDITTSSDAERNLTDVETVGVVSACPTVQRSIGGGGGGGGGGASQAGAPRGTG